MTENSDARRTAAERGEKQYFTGTPCKNGHLAPRWTSSGACTDCHRPKAKPKQPDGYTQLHVTLPIQLRHEDAANLDAINYARNELARYWPEVWARAKSYADSLVKPKAVPAGATLQPTSKAEFTVEAYRKAGWTDVQLVDAGLAQWTTGGPKDPT